MGAGLWKSQLFFPVLVSCGPTWSGVPATEFRESAPRDATRWVLPTADPDEAIVQTAIWAQPGGLLQRYDNRVMRLLDWETGALRYEVWARKARSGPTPWVGPFLASQTHFIGLTEACEAAAVDLATGERAWTRPLTTDERSCEARDQRDSHGLVLMGGQVAMVWRPTLTREWKPGRFSEFESWELVVMDGATGDVRFRRQVGPRRSDPGSSVDPTLIEAPDGDLVVAFSGQMARLDPDSGVERWTTGPDLSPLTGTFRSNGADWLVGSVEGDQAFQIVDMDTGAVLDEVGPRRPSGAVHKQLAIQVVSELSDGTRRRRGRVEAYDLESRGVRWGLDLDRGVDEIHVANGSVWVATFDRTLWRIDAETGEVLWTRFLAGIRDLAIRPGPDPLVGLRTELGDLYVLDPAVPPPPPQPFVVRGRVDATCCDDAYDGMVADPRPRVEVEGPSGDWAAAGPRGHFEVQGMASGMAEIRWRAWVPTTDPRAWCSAKDSVVVHLADEPVEIDVEIEVRLQCSGAFD